MAMDAQEAVRRAKLSGFEKHSLLVGTIVVFGAAVGAFFGNDAGGPARTIGLIGLGLAFVSVSSRAARLHRAGVKASLPTSVARVEVRIEPARAFTATTFALALVLPLAACTTALVVFKPAWLVLAGLLLLSAIGILFTASGEDRPYKLCPGVAEDLLQRLCMRADMPVPELVVEGHAVASAWTSGGRIHVTTALLRLLDDAEVEAVLAHELAHLARRDAAAMEICSAPSRVLLTFAGFVTPRLLRWTGGLLKAGDLGFGLAICLWLVAALGIPPAWVVGWASRLSVLGMSRAREFAADASAATLTGRPSALASALMKLDKQREWAPRADLREADALAVLCVIGIGMTGLARLFSTHPPTAERVRRLDKTESRIQAGWYAE